MNPAGGRTPWGGIDPVLDRRGLGEEHAFSHGVDVVVIAPHPDDAEMGCGGAIVRMVDAGSSVAILDLCAGEAATRGTASLRRSESQNAGAILGVDLRIQLGGRDGHLEEDLHGDRSTRGSWTATEAPLLARLRGLLESLEPRLVLIPASEGPLGSASRDRHRDHRAVARVPESLGASARKESVPWPWMRYPIHAVLPSGRGRLPIDVGPAWERRIAALEAHSSQLGDIGPWPRTSISHGQWIRSHRERALGDAEELGIPGPIEWLAGGSGGSEVVLGELLGSVLDGAPDRARGCTAQVGTRPAPCGPAGPVGS